MQLKIELASHPDRSGGGWVITYIHDELGGVRGVMITAKGNGHDEPSLNPGWDSLHLTQR